MTFMEWVGLILLIAFLFPFVVYVACKLGAYAVCRGRQIFEQQEQEKGRKDNGKQA